MKNPYFSVVIPTLNEQNFIENILTNLKNQTFGDFEVIVSDGNSSDKTTQKALKFKKYYPISIASSKIRNLSHQRNFGAKNASGKFIFFIDADNTIPNDFLEKTKKFIEENRLDAVIPKLVSGEKSFFNSIAYPVSIFMVKYSLFTPRPFSTGGNLIISKKTFEKTKGFSTKVFVGEDHEMVRQIKEIGAKIMLMSSTYVIFSMRRFEKEGFFTYIKYAYAFVYQILNRDVPKKIYKYKMGGDNY